MKPICDGQARNWKRISGVDLWRHFLARVMGLRCTSAVLAYFTTLLFVPVFFLHVILLLLLLQWRVALLLHFLNGKSLP